MTSSPYDYLQIEKKWQNLWYSNKIYESITRKNKKFFIHFAYPGVSGYLHVGHMRGFTYCDIIARYKRMDGFDVLFPAGFHATGIPSVGFAKKVERKDSSTLSILQDYGCSDEQIKKLVDPNEVVKYFSKVYVEDYWKRFGFFIDYTRIMSTISEGYKKFITWQFYKLRDLGFLIQKPHYAPFCPHCGPVAVDKSETDISMGGGSEILEFTVIKFEMDDGTILPAATLRPETIFGVTNMWINPEVIYVKANINNQSWILSEQGLEKIRYQYDQVSEVIERIPGKELIGKTCTVPLTNNSVPILPGTFADPLVATGIVMSVPAHAPYDYIALKETGRSIEPITIIDVKELGENPAKKVCEELNITSQQETVKLDEATDIVYKKEFHTGILNKHCGSYAGIKITDIKDTVKNDLIKQNKASLLREFSDEVICRCGEHVVIKQIPDQWFIKYSDETLTKKTKIHVETMTITPDEYKKQLPSILDWFDDRACIRKGSWLGTEFPFKKGWIIEPISDSTLYPAYYLISKYINSNQIKPDLLTNEFFDYVFLGEGTAKHELWKTIRDDVIYWYPVDINLGGKEHKTVHFPVFLMNHVAIMPEKMNPKGIFVHWWVTQKGKEKISKSKGGAEHVAEAAKTYGIDAMRLYYAHVGSSSVDIEWDTDAVMKYKNKISNIYKIIQQLRNIEGVPNKNLDNWLQHQINQHIKIINHHSKLFNLRDAANEIYFEIQKDIQWYKKRGGRNKHIIQWFIHQWIKLMTPITPHLSEELWHEDHDDFVSNQVYPTFYNEIDFPMEEVGEYLLRNLIEDINEILKVTKILPSKIFIYVSPKWKKDVFSDTIKRSENQSLLIGKLMKELMQDSDLRSFAKEISIFVKKIPNEIQKLQDADKKRYQTHIDEKQYLIDEKSYLESIFNCSIQIFRADEIDKIDPKNKAKFASPLKPAIYIE
jgi:leucyl-tRNA synthetase